MNGGKSICNERSYWWELRVDECGLDENCIVNFTIQYLSGSGNRLRRHISPREHRV